MKAEIKDRIEQIKKDEVPKGYKKTKVGTIPQEWGVEKLEEYTLKMKSGLSRQLESEDIGIPVIRSNNIKNYTIDFSDIKYWYNDDNQGADVKDYYLKDGDILVNFINSIAQIGKMAIFINRIGRNAIYTTNILQIRLKETLNVMFFKFFAETEKYNAYVLSITKPAVNQASFTTVEYKKMSLPIPIKEEQEKIASILSAWDIAIEKQEKLIELKKEQKKWLMQELLTGKKRLKGFEGEWKEVKLGKLCNVTTGKLDANAMEENGEYYFFTCAKDAYRINKYAFDTEALLISGNGANVGYIHYYKGKFNAYQRTYVLSDFQENIIFIKYLLDKYLSSRINKEKNEGNTPYITLGTITEMKIKIPKKLEEQTAIAEILKTADKEINLLEKELEVLKEQKKGLMQLLLMGIVRV